MQIERSAGRGALAAHSTMRRSHVKKSPWEAAEGYTHELLSRALPTAKHSPHPFPIRGIPYGQHWNGHLTSESTIAVR
jgi:hypothetical protein